MTRHFCRPDFDPNAKIYTVAKDFKFSGRLFRAGTLFDTTKTCCAMRKTRMLYEQRLLVPGAPIPVVPPAPAKTPEVKIEKPIPSGPAVIELDEETPPAVPKTVGVKVEAPKVIVPNKTYTVGSPRFIGGKK